MDSIRYKMNANTIEQSSVDRLELNEIGRMVFTTGKELFFGPYRRNERTGSFILIDPITSNTSAVGMIVDRVDAKDMVTEDALATLNLPEMGIGEEHYEVIREAYEESGRQGVSIKCITEKRQNMGLPELGKLSINTLVRTDWDTFKKVTARQQIDEDFKGEYRLTTDVYRLLSALKSTRGSRFKKLTDKPLEMDPLFILGHWRSGTTFVHNIFACDKHFGYTTTYQTVFPHLMFQGQPFFKKNMASLMSDKRPAGNMESKVDLPQGEEFALSNMMPYTYYNSWFFPKRWVEYCDRYLLFNDITEEERRIFMGTFMCLIRVSLWGTNGTRYLGKNPSHTGRVKTLLKVFPNAKFIYLKRNPYTIFESTHDFFTNTVQPLCLQDITNGQIEMSFIRVYRRLFYKYEEEKHLIPEDNLVEVKFEDFKKDAFATTEGVYGSLNLPGFKEFKADIEKYLSEKRGYERNQYKYEDRTVRLVGENWGMTLKEWDCDL